MTNNQSPNYQKLHLLGFITVFILISSFIFYQLFVDQNHQRIPLKSFLKPNTLKQAFSSLKYQPKDLGSPQTSPDPNQIKVLCQDFCQFILADSPQKPIPALIDNNGEGRLETLNLRFYDPLSGLIGYQNQDDQNPTFFVIDLKPQLLQFIRLSPSQQHTLSFVSYYSLTKQILFKSVDNENHHQEFMLYSANSPSLTLLGENQP